MGSVLVARARNHGGRRTTARAQERPTMILYGIDNIRDLFGHRVNLGMIRRNPICRLGL